MTRPFSPFAHLGAASPCEDEPADVSSQSLKKYAKDCGKAVALKWASNRLGVDVQGCASVDVDKIPDCIANNYSISLDVVDKDGNVHWDTIAHDAGAVAGVVVCAAYGASAAAMPFCAYVGGEIADIAIKLGSLVYDEVISIFFGGDEPLGWACEKMAFPKITTQQMVRDVSAFLRSPISPAFDASVLLGPAVVGTLDAGAPNAVTQNIVYWNRMYVMRGLAQATAAVLSGIMQRSGASVAPALRALAPVAPPGWVELARSVANPFAGEKLDYATQPDYLDYTMSIGGLFSTLTMNKLPSYLRREFWSAVPPAKDLLLRYFVAWPGCPRDGVLWGQADVKDLHQVTDKFHQGEQTYWVYSVPASLDKLAREATPEAFDQAMKLWRESIDTNVMKKIQLARQFAAPAPSSALPKIAAGATIAGWVWWRFFR